MRRMARSASLMVGAVVVAGAACSADDPGTAVPPPATAVTTVDDGSASSLPPSSTIPPEQLPGPEPTGVPGIDDPDPFCAAWAVLSGSVQTIAVAAGFGGATPQQLTELEVAAAASMAAALQELDARWPSAIEDEREVVLVDVFGGWSARSDAALAELAAAGASPEQIDQLADAWQAYLARRDPEAALPIDAVPPSPLGDLVVAAAAAVLASSGPVTDDVALRAPPVPVPATRAYLVEECPDLVAGLDAV